MAHNSFTVGCISLPFLLVISPVSTFDSPFPVFFVEVVQWLKLRIQAQLAFTNESIKWQKGDKYQK